MPNKNPEKARELKHAWYVKNKERLLQQKREKRAAQKKVKPPKPPKPAPTPEQEARARELNRLACLRYRTKNAAYVRLLNRDYYHKHREQIVQQQRDRRARDRQIKESPFRKLRALADVCSSRLLELNYGYASIAPKKAGPRGQQTNPKTVSETYVCIRERDRESKGPPSSTLPPAHGKLESQRGVRGL